MVCMILPHKDKDTQSLMIGLADPDRWKLIPKSAGLGNSFIRLLRRHLGRGLPFTNSSAEASRWARYFDRHPRSTVIIWNGLKGTRRLAADAARAAGHEVWFMELSPLPGRISVDPVGVNHGSSLPRTPSFYAAWRAAHPEIEVDLRMIAAEIAERPPRAGSGVRHDPLTDEMRNRHFIFVPLQVPDDSQLTEYGAWTNSVESFLNALQVAAEHLPAGWDFVVKKHPSATYKFNVEAFGHPRIVFSNTTSTLDLVKHAKAVLTINSSVGLQAMLFDKPVIITGEAAYNVEGLVERAHDLGGLCHLVACADTVMPARTDRSNFIAYITQEYYPLASAIRNGTYGLVNARLRHERMQELLSCVNP
ncbi:hypothetical protein LAZ29_16340 [Cereibacter sphaeroides]|uniref:capsular polysaccharide export protein, LipB/KpsS family n=1 Tax=Cereibacter sphaeroides TaxID=1063 RepID=UPI001F37473E|nr:hypothetical protein [Cereibacter sphaeroides]MCE6952504.1 hypothetical protein [Cereibacter sphaeroides]